MLFFCWGGGGDFIRTMEPVIRKSASDIRRTGMDIRSSLNLRWKRAFIPGEKGWEKAYLILLEQLSRLLENVGTILE